MTNRPKRIGTAGETGVVRYLRGNGFPGAERRALHGVVDRGDITGTPGVTWEVKCGQKAKAAAWPSQITKWIMETDQEAAANGDLIGILVIQRTGYAPERAGAWRALVPVGTLHSLMSDAMTPPLPIATPRALLAPAEGAQSDQGGMVDLTGRLNATTGGGVAEMPLEDMVIILRAAGYGTKLPPTARATGE